MEDLSLHILDIVENSLRSDAKLVEISLVEDSESDLLTIRIRDDGTGMDPHVLCRARDPFFTTKERRQVGLGLALLAQAAREAEGSFDIVSSPGAGTTIAASFHQNHVDCRPLGDLRATIDLLASSNPDVDFVFDYRTATEHLRLDTRQDRGSSSSGSH